MKKTTKIISIILAVLMLMSVLSVSVFAADTNAEKTGDDISYSLQGDTLIISGTGAISDYEHGSTPENS